MSSLIGKGSEGGAAGGGLCLPVLLCFLPLSYSPLVCSPGSCSHLLPLAPFPSLLLVSPLSFSLCSVRFCFPSALFCSSLPSPHIILCANLLLSPLPSSSGSVALTKTREGRRCVAGKRNMSGGIHDFPLLSPSFFPPFPFPVFHGHVSPLCVIRRAALTLFTPFKTKT